MHAIVLADRKPFGIDPISQQYCPALLPLGGRALVIHTIEDLASAGFNKISLVISSQAYQIENLLGDGSRWGVEIEYLLSRGEEKPSVLINRYVNRMGSAQMLLRGDMIRSACISDVLQNVSEKTTETSVYFDTRPAGVVFTRNIQQSDMVDLLDWHQLQNKLAGVRSKLDLGNCHCSYLNNQSEYFTAALAVATGEFINVNPRGLRAENGLIHGCNARVDDQVRVEGNLVVGDNVRIESGVQVSGSVVISNDVLIDKDARLSNCLVLDGTYLGKGVNLENCILFKNHIYRIDLGEDVSIADDYLASELAPTSTPILDRLLAIILLLLSMPLWVYAGFCALIQSPRHIFNKVKLFSNRKKNELMHSTDIPTVDALQWNLSSPLLKRLPLLLNVIRGDLRLIGSKPEFQGNARDTQISHLSMPSFGLLSVNQIDLDKNVTELEKNLNEYLYERQRNAFSDIRYLLAFVQQLFQAGSWQEINVIKI